MESAPGGRFAVMMRIPGWAERAKVTVNGKRARAGARPGTYASVRRTWKAGDEILLTLPMRVRLLEAHPKAEHLRSHLAVMRGKMLLLGYVYSLGEPHGGE